MPKWDRNIFFFFPCCMCVKFGRRIYRGCGVVEQKENLILLWHQTFISFCQNWFEKQNKKALYLVEHPTCQFVDLPIDVQIHNGSFNPRTLGKISSDILSGAARCRTPRQTSASKDELCPRPASRIFVTMYQWKNGINDGQLRQTYKEEMISIWGHQDNFLIILVYSKG